MIVAFEIITDVVFGIEIAVIVVVVVNGEGPTLNPVVRIIIVGDEAKGPIIGGGRGLDTAVGTVIVIQLFLIIFTFRSFKKELRETNFFQEYF